MIKSALVAYIFNAMTTWSPVSGHVLQESEVDAVTRYQQIADDIAEVGMDPTEASSPVVAGTQDADVKNSILLAAVASMETNFAKFVDDGTCNKPTFQADRRGSCDGKSAWTIWQLHTMGGLAIRGDELVGRRYATPAELLDLWDGPRLVANRRGAARMALHEMRYSIRRTGTLCLYSGETSRLEGHEGKCATPDEGGIPKASARLNRAVQYLATHPVQSQET